MVVSTRRVFVDLPLCRREMVMLPGVNQVLDVFQSMYTRMFETILAKEGQMYYVHLPPADARWV